MADDGWIITTAVGTGAPGFAGDGGPAAQALLNGPFDVGFDPAGNLYFSDTFNHRIRRVDASSGIITTVAGIGGPGYAGDGGPATAAAFNEPYGIAVDGSGNIYLADRHNHCVRRIDGLSGLVTTYAGNRKAGFAGDGGPAAEGRSRRTQRAGLRPGATAARSSPTSPIIGSGLSICSAARSRPLPAPGPRRIAATAARPRRPGCSAPARSRSPRTAPSTSSSARAARCARSPADRHRSRRSPAPVPAATAATAARRALRSSTRRRNSRSTPAATSSSSIPKTTRSAASMRRTRIVETIAGGRQGADGDGGPATAAGLGRPHGAVVGPDGAIYIGDTENHRIRKLTRRR